MSFIQPNSHLCPKPLVQLLHAVHQLRCRGTLGLLMEKDITVRGHAELKEV